MKRIIFLHHQNKLNKEFNSAFAGSSAFLEDIELAYELKKNNDKQTYIFIPIKDRNNISNYVAFKYNQDNTLIKINLDYALETNEDAEIKELILSLILALFFYYHYIQFGSALPNTYYVKSNGEFSIFNFLFTP